MRAQASTEPIDQGSWCTTRRPGSSRSIPGSEGVWRGVDGLVSRSPVEEKAINMGAMEDVVGPTRNIVQRSTLTPAHRQRQTAALKHSLYVRAPSGLQLRSRRVRRLAARVKAGCPWLQPSDEPTLRSWCELEIITAGVFAQLLEHGACTTGDTLDGKSGNGAPLEPRRLLGEFRQLKQTQLRFAETLGLTPSSRMALGVQAGQGAHTELQAKLAEIRLRQEQRREPT